MNASEGEYSCCAECGQVVHASEFHPYLYCVLYRGGIKHQEQYLRDSGFVRAGAVAVTQKGKTQ